jgi:spore photoproduct lyase
MEKRIEAARKCQEAGYPVRIRFSPMIPFAGWEDEVRHMVRRVFEETRPEVVTIEPLRFCSYDDLRELFAPGFIDPEFMEAMRSIPEDAEDWQKREFPDDYRIRMYRAVFDEMLKVSPRTPVGLCREKRRVWEALRSEFERWGQHPDRYVCNCGPTSAGRNPLLARACV